MKYSLVSNNCISIYLYTEYYRKDRSLIEYTSPLIGSWFTQDEHYVRFCEKYNYYFSLEPIFGEPAFGDPVTNNKDHVNSAGEKYPVMLLDDIEIRWQHETSESALLKKFKSRLEVSQKLEPVFLWDESSVYNAHTKKERATLVNRFCSIPHKKVYLTKYQSEECEKENTIVKFVPEFAGLTQSDMRKQGTVIRNTLKECIDKYL